MIKQVGLRIESKLADWIKTECKKENRSFNNFISTLLLTEQSKRFGKEKEEKKDEN